MRTKILLCVFIMIITLTGCATAWDGTDTAQQDQKITQDFEQIPGSENLYYCKATKVVYWIGGSYQTNVMGKDYTTSYMTVYYAPNGFPYLFSPEIKKIYEINNQ